MAVALCLYQIIDESLEAMKDHADIKALKRSHMWPITVTMSYAPVVFWYIYLAQRKAPKLAW